MIVLKLVIMKFTYIFLFNLSKAIFSLNNNTFNINYQNLLPIIQNTPVENNIPLIIQEIDKNRFINNKPIIVPTTQNQKELITNTEIKINTTAKDPMCTKECCMGCQVQFNKLISQKNCIINICKCQIISINNININNNTNTSDISNNQLEKEKIIILIGSMNNMIDNENLNFEKNSSYFFYWFLMFVFICYESYIIYNLNIKDNKFLTRENSIEILVNENDKEKRINNYMELLYGDEELIECLI